MTGSTSNLGSHYYKIKRRRCPGGSALSSPVLNKPLVLVGVLVYSLLVGGLRWYGVIGDRGAYILFGVMLLDLAATHWLIRRRARGRDR